MGAWRSETRTGHELVTQWVSLHPTKASAARVLGLHPGHLRIWLLESERGMEPSNALRIARKIGIPFEAVVFKNRPVCELLRDAA